MLTNIPLLATCNPVTPLKRPAFQLSDTSTLDFHIHHLDNSDRHLDIHWREDHQLNCYFYAGIMKRTLPLNLIRFCYHRYRLKFNAFTLVKAPTSVRTRLRFDDDLTSSVQNLNFLHTMSFITKPGLYMIKNQQQWWQWNHNGDYSWPILTDLTNDTATWNCPKKIHCGMLCCQRQA